MKTLLLSVFVLFSISSYCMPKEWIPPYSLEKSVFDEKLSKNQAVYYFKFIGIEGVNLSRTIDYSIDGEADRAEFNLLNEIKIVTTPGRHIFQFFYTGDYTEIYTDSLLISPQHRDYYSVILQPATMIQVAEKPVIYLYPEETKKINVKLNVNGNMTFTYPAYKEGWDFIAEPNGDLKFGNKTYNYLFWESSNNYSIPSIALKTGFVVKGEESLTFLEEKLTLAGLTSKEKADFITYWGPRLAQNPQSYVRFEFNNSCNRFAELNITPKPDNVYRIYMLWFKVPESFVVDNEQEITPIRREGFTVVEWGGQEMKLLNKSLSYNL